MSDWNRVIDLVSIWKFMKMWGLRVQRLLEGRPSPGNGVQKFANAMAVNHRLCNALGWLLISYIRMYKVYRQFPCRCAPEGVWPCPWTNPDSVSVAGWTFQYHRISWDLSPTSLHCIPVLLPHVSRKFSDGANHMRKHSSWFSGDVGYPIQVCVLGSISKAMEAFGSQWLLFTPATSTVPNSAQLRRHQLHSSTTQGSITGITHVLIL